MHRWNLNLAALLFAVSLLSQVRLATSAEPPPKLQPGDAAPKRPEQNLKFQERPSIPFSALQFANDDVRRRAEQFHQHADAIFAKGSAERYKDMTTFNPNEPWYVGNWSISGEKRRAELQLKGKVVDGRDQFHSSAAMGRADSGAWGVELNMKLGDPRRDFETMTVQFWPVGQPTAPAPPLPPRPFQLLTRGVSVETSEGPLEHRLVVHLPHSQDAERTARLMYSTPDAFLELASEDIEALRKQAKQELPKIITVYDNQQVSPGAPPNPGPVNQLSPETTAKVQAAIDARLDADLAILKADYRDMHKAIQLALPREMFETK